MFPRLEQESGTIDDPDKVKEVMEDPAFSEAKNINVLPLIYDETKKQCNIMVFDFNRAMAETASIVKVEKGSGRKHPVYLFLNKEEQYICEVRYGGASANALQRGLWTDTRKGIEYFDSLTQGWIRYSHNLVLVNLFSKSLVSSSKSHEEALKVIQKDIKSLKIELGIPT